MIFKRTLVSIICLFIIIQGVGPATVLAAIPDTCESHGIRYDCTIEAIDVTTQRAEYDLGGFGGTNLTSTNLSTQEWPQDLGTGRIILPGVTVLATYERETKLNSSLVANMSLGEKPRYVNVYGPRTLTTGAVHILQYQLNFGNDIAMNGVSKVYFRSPLKWDANWTAHYLQVRTLNTDGTERDLIAGARYAPDDTTNLDTRDVVLKDARLYYELEGLFPANVTYTIDEWVVMRSVGGTPLVQQGLTLFMAEGQDIGGDELADFRLFPGHGTSERIYSQSTGNARGHQFQEVGWSARLAVGMGAGGTIGLIMNTADAGSITIRVPFVPAAPALDGGGVPNGNIVHVTVPLKFSRATTVIVSVTPYTGWTTRYANAQGFEGVYNAGPEVSQTLTAVTGTVSFSLPLHATTAWSAGAADHWYDVAIQINAPAESDCETDGEANCLTVSYPMSEMAIPSGAKAHHIVDYTGSGWATARGVYAQPWVEVTETYDPSAIAVDRSTRVGTVLIGAGLMLAGIGILFAAGLMVVASCTVGAVVTVGVACVAAAALTISVIIPLASGAFAAGYVGVRAGLNGAAPSAVFDKEMLAALGKGVGKMMAIGACASLAVATFTPALTGLGAGAAFAAKGALGLGCAAGLLLANGGILGLIDFVYDLVKIVTKAIELGGHLLAQLADYILVFLENAESWVKAAYIAFTALTFLWAIREGLLWIMNMLWPITSVMAPNARRHHQRFESIIENVSVPLWDAVMARWWGAYRGRYFRQRRGGNPD